MKLLMLSILICVTPCYDIRTQLFTQILTDYPDLRDCLKSEKELDVEAVDLNHDGNPEYKIEIAGPCNRGAQNCTIYLYRRTAAGLQSILEGASGLDLAVLKTSSNGYKDLRLQTHDSAATQAPCRQQAKLDRHVT